MFDKIFIMWYYNNRKRGIEMNEELLKELINRIEMCQRGLLNTCDCTECPLYKDFGDGQNICLKLLEEKKE